MLQSGKSNVDIITQKSLSGFSYTNLISVVATANVNSTSWILASTLPTLNILPHKQLVVPTRPYIASTSNDDNIVGIGARLVIVTGLDENYNIQEEVVALNGQTPVQTVLTYIRIFELLIINFGSNVNSIGDSVSVGDIYCGTGIFTLGIPTLPIVGIAASDNDPNSRVGIFTIPDGRVALLKSMTILCSLDITNESIVYVQICSRPFGLGSNQWFKIPAFYINNSFQYLPQFNFPFPGKSDFQIRVSSNNTRSKKCSIELTFELKELRL